MKGIIKTTGILLIVTVVLAVVAPVLLMLFFGVLHLVAFETSATELLVLDSPSGDYTLILKQHSGGATTDFTVKGKVRNNRTGLKRKIYSVYREENASAIWISEDEVEINGRRVNIHRDVYVGANERRRDAIA